jgi:hypothetical protein
MVEKHRRILSILLMFALWFPQLFLYLMPHVLGMSTSIDVESINPHFEAMIEISQDSASGLLSSILLEPLYYLLLIIGGLIASLSMYIGSRYWKKLLVIVSLLYLFSWYFAGSTAHLPIDIAYQQKWNLSVFTGDYFNFFYRDIFLPFVNAVVLIAISIQVIWSRKRKEI